MATAYDDANWYLKWRRTQGTSNASALNALPDARAILQDYARAAASAAARSFPTISSGSSAE